jgi:hypothetical protein
MELKSSLFSQNGKSKSNRDNLGSWTGLIGTLALCPTRGICPYLIKLTDIQLHTWRIMIEAIPCQTHSQVPVA